MAALPRRRYYDSQRGLLPFLADWCRYQLSMLPELPERIEAWLLRHVVTIVAGSVVLLFWTLMGVGLFA